MLRLPGSLQRYSFAYLTLTLAFPVILPSAASAAEASVRGTIVDEGGRPVAGAQVRVGSAGPVASDAKGRFAVAGVPAGAYVETVSAARYEPFRATVVVPSDPQEIVLHPSIASLRVIGSVVAHPRATFNASPIAVKVFPREAYRDQGQPDLGSVLAQTPGATPRFVAGSDLAVRGVPMFGSVRGSQPFETAVSFDGVPLALPSSGAFDLAAIPSFVLGDVEVSRGPGDVAGVAPNAIAGALNLRSAEPTSTRRALAEFSIDTQGGSFDDISYTGTSNDGRLAFAAMVATDGSTGPLANRAYPLSLGAGFARVDGDLLVPGPDPLHATDLYACCVGAPSDDLRRAQLLKLRYAPNDALTLTATYLGSQTSRALAGARGLLLPLAYAGTTLDTFASFARQIDARENARLALYDLDARIDRGRDGFDARVYAYDAGTFDDDGPPGARTYALTGTANFFGAPSRTFANTLAAIDTPQTSPPFAQRDSVRGARLAWQHETANGIAIFSAERRSGTSNGSARGTALDTLLNASIQTHPNAKMELDAGAGVDRHAALGRAWDLAAFRASASYHPHDALAFRFAAGTSFAPPPIEMLQPEGAPTVTRNVGLPTTVARFAPSYLQPERAVGADLGAEWKLHGNTTTASLDLYITHATGAFARRLATGPVATYTWVNAAPLDESGVEASLVQFKRVGLGYIIQGTLSNAGRLPSADTYFAAPVTDATAPLAPNAYLQAYGEISYHWPKGSRLSLGTLYEGSDNPYDRPAFAEFNANLELSAGAKGKFQISIENLFDAYDTRVPYGLTLQNALPPRTIRIMYRQSAGGGAVYER